MYKRKTRDEYEVQGYYNGEFEMVVTEDKRKEAVKRLREYQENEPGIVFRIKKIRVKIE